MNANNPNNTSPNKNIYAYFSYPKKIQNEKLNHNRANIGLISCHQVLPPDSYALSRFLKIYRYKVHLLVYKYTTP